MWLAVLAVIGSILVGVPSSAVAAPGAETTEVDESPALGTESALAAFLQKLASSGKSKSSSNQMEPSLNRRINLDGILRHLPEGSRFSTTDRQRLVADLVSKGVSVEPSSRLTTRRQGKSISSPDLQRGRIISGNPTAVSDAPWQVGLVFSPSHWLYTNIDYWNFFCGGSIIGSRWILTAAHCVEDLTAKEMSVVFGIDKLPEDKLVPRSNKASVNSIIIHPSYRTDSDYETSNDIALIELSTTLKFSGKVAPIRLATPALDLIRPNPSDLFVSGWGATSIDEDGYRVYPAQLQSGTTPEVACPDGSIYGSSEQALICAGSAGGTQVDACQGDSGGPLVYSKNTAAERALVGVVSFGPPCPPAGIGAYANVSHFSSWIMCHASVHFPLSGPHFCGDEAGFLTVADTLKVGMGAWGGSRQSIQWSQRDPSSTVSTPIRGANKTSLSMKGLFGKVISVRITAGSLSEFKEFNSGEPVVEARQIDFHYSGDFAPCVSLNYAPPNKGKCVGTKGNFNGQLLSEAGLQLMGYDDDYDPIEFEYGYWAYKDFALPKNTVEWSWGLVHPWSPGIVVNDSEHYGADYIGVTASRTPLVFDSWDPDSFSVFSRSQYPMGYDENGNPDYDLLNPIGGPVNTDGFVEFSQLMVNGKGRILLGTLGDEELGSRLTFESIIVMSLYR